MKNNPRKSYSTFNLGPSMILTDALPIKTKYFRADHEPSSPRVMLVKEAMNKYLKKLNIRFGDFLKKMLI